MSLASLLTDDLKTAMKNRDTERTATLRMIRAAIIEEEKSGRGDVTDDKVLAILRKMVKQRADSAEQYDQGGRPELAEQERSEITIINDYLPQLADEPTTRLWAQQAIEESGASSPADFGRAMGALMKQHKADVDGALAKKVINELLAGD